MSERSDREGGQGVHPLAVAAAVFVGLAIPLLASGRAAAGVALGLGVAALLAAPGRRQAVASLWQGLKSPLGIGVCVTLSIWLVSVAGSIDFLRSLSVWGRMVGFLLAAGLIYGFFVHAPAALRISLKSLIGAGLFFAALGLVGIHGLSPLLGLLRGEGFSEVNAPQLLKGYGSAVACLAPVILWAGFRLSPAWRFASAAYLPLGLALILSVDSLAGLFGLAAALVFGGAALILRGAAQRTLILGLASGLALALVALILAQLPPVRPPGALEALLEGGDAGWAGSLLDAHRQVIWGFARDLALEAPFFGHGINVSNFLPGADHVVPEFNQELIPGHPHNWLLEVFLETGAVGALCLVAALGLLLRRLAGAAGGAGAAGIAVFAAFWGSSFFNFSIWSAWWQVTYLVLTALVLAGASAARGGPGASQKPGRKRAP